MSSNDNHIDKTFKSKLSEQKFVVPEAFVADMQKRLGVSAVAKTKVKWFWILGGVCVLGIVAFFFYYNDVSNLNTWVPNKEKEVNTSNSKINYQGELTEVKTGNSILHSNIDSNKNSTSNELHLNSEIDTEINTSADLNYPISGPDFNPNYLPDVPNSTKNQVYTKPSNFSKVEKNYKSKTDEVTASSSDVNYAEADSPNKNDYNAIQASNGSQNIKSNENESFATDIDESDVTDAIRDAEIVVIDVTPDDTTKPIVKYVYKDSVVIRDSIVIRDSLVIRDSVIEIPMSHGKWELQVFGGVAKVSPNYEVSSELVDIYETTSSKINSPLFGFNVGYNFGKVGLQSGASYNEYGANYSIDEFSVDLFDTIIDNSFYQNLYDSTGAVYDSVYITQFDTLAWPDTLSSSILNFNNSYSTIHIPVRLSYTFDLGNWKVIPYLGLGINLTIGKPSGDYIQSAGGDLLSVTPKSLSLSYQASLQVRRELGSFHLFAEPIYSGMLTHMVDQPFGTRVKYNQFGVRLGLGVKF